MAERILRGVAGTISFKNTDYLGSEAAAAGVMTVKVDSDRTDSTILAAGSVTTLSGTGTYQRALTAAQVPNLDRLEATWTDAGDSSTHTTYHDVVGGYYFTVQQAQAFDAELATFTAAEIAEARAEVEDEIEAICGVAFVPRYAVVTLNGTDCDTLYLPHRYVRSLVSATVDDVAADVSGWTVYPTGELRRDFGYFPSGLGNVTVRYEHGLDTVPAPIRKAALVLLASRALADHDPSMAGVRSLSVEGYSVTFGGETSRPATGIDAVDRVLSRYDFRPRVGVVQMRV